MKQLVLVGAGHAHVEVLRALAEAPSQTIATTLVSPQPFLVYTGMLPGHVAGHYSLEDITLDLRPLLERARVRFVPGIASHVDTSRREVVCADTTGLGYDALSLDVGSEPFTDGTRGVDRHAVTVRPPRALVEGWNAVLDRALRGEVEAITLVGGGAAGVELALAMAWRLRGAPKPTHLRILEHGPRILPEFSEGARRRLLRRLRRAGIGVHPGCTVREVGEGFVKLASGLQFVTDAVFWTAGAVGPAWLGDSGLAVDPRGFVRTNEQLRSVSHAEVFACGDCAIDDRHPTPRAGVFAVRAGPVLAHNLVAFLEGRPMRPFTPRSRFLALLGTGGRHAVGTWGGLSWQGGWAWRWKERVDRKWMARYRG